MYYLLIRIKPKGKWREDAWHFLMVALDERVLCLQNGQKDKQETSVIQYCGLVIQAVDYLKTYPNTEFASELKSRVLRETLPARERVSRRFLPKAEKDRLLEAIASVQKIVAEL